MSGGSSLDALVAPLDCAGYDQLDIGWVKPEQLPEYARSREHNRFFREIMPTWANRVTVTAADEAGTYVNANYIAGFDGKPKQYIASQGPLPGACLDRFVQMVWEHRCCAIVMATDLEEGGKTKCERYWPREAGYAKTFGDIQVQTREVVEEQGYLRHRLRLVRGNDTLDVMHFFYNTWPDHGVPTRDGKIYTKDMLTLLMAVRRHRQATDNFASPLLVHCSAGVGRTGCFIVVDQAYHMLDAGQRVDLLALIARVRKERMALVQKTVQYELVWNAVAEYARFLLKKRGEHKPALAAATVASSTASRSTNNNTSSSSSSTTNGVEPSEPQIGGIYRTTGPYDNPDQREEVLKFKGGESCKLLEVTEYWWRVSMDDEVGWVLPEYLKFVPIRAAPRPKSAAFPSDSLSMSTDAGLTQLNKAKAPSAGAPQQPRLSQPSISPFNNPFGAAPATTTTTTTAAASNTNAAPSKVVMRQPAAGDSKPGVSPFPGPPSTAAPKRPNSVVIGPGANPFGAPPSTSTPSPKPPANPFAPAEKPASANPFAGSSNTSSKPGSKGPSAPPTPAPHSFQMAPVSKTAERPKAQKAAAESSFAEIMDMVVDMENQDQPKRGSGIAVDVDEAEDEDNDDEANRAESNRAPSASEDTAWGKTNSSGTTSGAAAGGSGADDYEMELLASAKKAEERAREIRAKQEADRRRQQEEEEEEERRLQEEEEARQAAEAAAQQEAAEKVRRQAEAAAREAARLAAEEEAKRPKPPAEPYLSTLPPWTVLEENGTIRPLAPVSPQYKAPQLDPKRVRDPSAIIPPAIVSHDHSWRAIGPRAEYAMAKV